MKRILILLLSLLLVGCGGPTPIPSGSAIEHAAAVNARAATTATAADAAKLDAAAKKGRANALEDAAKKEATADRIKAAVDARVEAESAEAVAEALTEIAIKASAEVKAAEEAAKKERIELQKADDDRAWLRFCRMVGLIATVGGVVAGAVLGYLISPVKGISLGILLAGLGQAVVFYGATITWLPLACGSATVLVLAIWALEHRREKQGKDHLDSAAVEMARQWKATASRLSDEVRGDIDAVSKSSQPAAIRDTITSLLARAVELKGTA